MNQNPNQDSRSSSDTDSTAESEALPGYADGLEPSIFIPLSLE